MTVKEAIKIIDETIVTPHIHPDKQREWDEAMIYAVQSLLKQVPKKIKNSFYCPNCKKMIQLHYNEKAPKYCSECGQRIDWGEVDNG